MNEFANVLEPSYVIRRDRLLPGRFGMDYVRMTYPVQIWHPVQIWCDTSTGRLIIMNLTEKLESPYESLRDTADLRGRMRTHNVKMVQLMTREAFCNLYVQCTEKHYSERPCVGIMWTVM